MAPESESKLLDLTQPLDQAIALLVIYKDNRQNHRSIFQRFPLFKGREHYCDEALAVLHDYKHNGEESLDPIKQLLAKLINTTFYTNGWIGEKHVLLNAPGYETAFTTDSKGNDLFQDKEIKKSAGSFREAVFTKSSDNPHFNDVLESVAACLMKVIIDAGTYQEHEKKLKKEKLQSIPQPLWNMINRESIEAQYISIPASGQLIVSSTAVLPAEDLYRTWTIPYVLGKKSIMR